MHKHFPTKYKPYSLSHTHTLSSLCCIYMERTETVCCYCGVSYLIFHEFQQLRTELAQLEAELQDLRETAQKEKAQREALELGRLEKAVCSKARSTSAKCLQVAAQDPQI
uniref:Uncharacterized protein n=1 Tax=Pundamilia nyererei TaxID=303518 RepID=A0A3B4FWE0_9CICH